MVWNEKDGEWMTGFPSELGKQVLFGTMSIQDNVYLLWKVTTMLDRLAQRNLSQDKQKLHKAVQLGESILLGNQTLCNILFL